MNHECAGAVRDRILDSRQNFFIGQIDCDDVGRFGQRGKVRLAFPAHDFGATRIDQKNFARETEIIDWFAGSGS